MRPALASLLGVALALAGCATIESVFKPDTPPATAPAPPAPAHAPAPPRARPAPLPPLQPQLSEAEERRLRAQATRQITDAERAAQAVKADGLEPAQRETLASIQSFIRQAHQALAARDYERADTLARKAEAIAKDLPQSGR